MPITPLDLFIRVSDNVIKFEANFIAIDDNDHNVYSLDIRRREIEKIWEKTKTSHDNCLRYLETAEDAEPSDLDSADAKYSSVFNAYVRCLASIEEKLGVLSKTAVDKTSPQVRDERQSSNSIADGTPRTTGSGVSNRQQNSSLLDEPLSANIPPGIPTEGQMNLGHAIALPHFEVDVFRGDYLTWPKFRDHFTTVFMRSSISPIQRLLYLIQKTSGDAREIVDKFPVEHSSFDLAWQALSTAYNNPRMLVNNQLKILYGLPVLETESSSALKSLQRGINGCLSALAIYNIPTGDWDPMLVFMCLQRLPKHTVTLWEQSIKNKTALSKWNELNDFLTERVQTLDCLRDLTSSELQKKGNDKKVKSHHTGAQKISGPSGSQSKNSSLTRQCVLCQKKSHSLGGCPQYTKLSINERFLTVKRLHCCVNCLSKLHATHACSSQHRCARCALMHHTSLHREDAQTSPPQYRAGVGGETNAFYPQAHNNVHPQAGSSSQQNHANGHSFNTVHSQTPGQQNLVNRQTFFTGQNRSIILATATVNIIHNGVNYPARALIDPASEASFITGHMQRMLKLPFEHTNARVSGVNETASSARKICELKIGSRWSSRTLPKVSALVLPAISGNLPSFSVPDETVAKLPNEFWADAHIFDSRPVDLLLGADVYDQLLENGLKKNILGSLTAQRTIFGWILTGSLVVPPVPTVLAFRTKIEFSAEDNLNSTLLRFWELEEIPRRKILSPEDKFCEENYRKTTRRNSEGRYIVTLPLKPEFPNILSLGHSRSNVLRQFLRNEASLIRKPDIKSVYDKVVKEYLELGHMKRVTPGPLSDSRVCYLPHHPVINMEKQTSKLRVVFNASNKTSNGKCLNDMLYVGPTLQADLVLLILRWRVYKYVFNCDITQMYRQIRVDESHAPLQRILFRESPAEDVVDYELQTVTFGVNCAPYLAIRTLLQLAENCRSDYPLAAEILEKCMYVDDVLSGAHELSEACAARDQLISALSSAKFELRKWTANDKQILNRFPPEHLVDAKLLSFVESSNSKPLGIRWNAQTDDFFFCVTPIPYKEKHTKREVLSAIAKLFDPVGWLSPVIIVAKIIMQKVWLDNIDWDDFLPEATESDWQRFVKTHSEVNQVKVPRWIKYSPDCCAELHVFSDASEKAYAGAIYIRIKTSSGEYIVNLLASKTKVAPLKSISLPRLELCGAVLASELLKTVLSEMEIDLQHVYCWTDSTIVLAWLKKTPSTWSTFVANRVCRIQENVGNHNWYHVRSEDNPADLGSRGVSPSELASNILWWHGPLWLRHDSSLWNVKDLSMLDTSIEMRAVKCHASFLDTLKEDVLDSFSSLDHASRLIAYMLRFLYNTHPKYKGKKRFESKSVSGEEIKNVHLHLAILAQKMHFGEDYLCLQNGEPLPHKSSLVPFNPFLDQGGVMRLNGRLAKSPSLSYYERHPILLPYKSRFTKLLVEFIHLISIHGGNQLVARLVRCEYWVPRLNNLVRAAINNCKQCIIHRKRTCSQIMAALPPERTAINRPFTTTGVDYAGPFEIKSFTGRACKITKGYVCVFVCFSTKAIHLEAVSDLSSDAFLAAFNRFIARRGCPSTIMSDNGTNFVGASRELSKNIKICLRDIQNNVVAAHGYQGLVWRFIPAGAPHMGGLWEAGVKSFKHHFRRQMKNLRYTFEEFSTILARIEACLNSRPLCPLSDNVTDIVALTPGHFLIGSPILAPPEPVIEDAPASLVNRYRKMLAVSQHFCVRWKNEYLNSLHKRYKWQHPKRDLTINDIVVVKHESLPPTSWRLGRIVKIYHGEDGHIRVADVRTELGIIKRPVTKLVVLNH